MSRSIRVAACSPDIRVGELGSNLERVRDAVTAAAAAGARLIVLPELATSGYVFRDQDEARGAAMTRGDARWSMIQDALPADAVAVVGYCERDGSELFNTAAVLMRTTRIGDYRKSHLWGAERTIFESGDSAGGVRHSGRSSRGRDLLRQRVPRSPPEDRARRSRAARAAGQLARRAATPRRAAAGTIQAMAAARSSRLATVIADRSGTERGVEWTAGTTIIDEDGWIAAEPADGAAIATLTLREMGDKSLPPHNDLFVDRRPDLY